MKKILFAMAMFLSTVTFAQTIQSVDNPYPGQIMQFWDQTYVRPDFKVTLDTKAYAVVYSVDPIGTTKVLKGKNKNYWAGVVPPSSNGNFLVYELGAILDGISEGEHTLRIDVYGKNFNDLTDTQEITFYIDYINPITYGRQKQRSLQPGILVTSRNLVIGNYLYIPNNLFKDTRG